MPYQELTFNELAEDETFFSGLRNGDFVLVLGAGFSFGIKNKNTEFNTIPTASQFITHTNTKFNKQTTTYAAAASVWTEKINDTATLFEEFINLFLVNEKEFDYQLFNAIYYPDWHNIFALNFDNVLETIQSSSSREKYPVRFYPQDPSNDVTSNIIHLHGLLNEKSKIDDIVFTSTSYTKLNDAKHDLYDVLHGDVDVRGKNLIIIGTQFDEQIVFDKFFDGLNRKDITIYHFDFQNGNVREKREFKEKDYKFINLSDYKGNSGTHAFLQFINDYQHKIKNIKLDGAETINQDFINRINAGQTFSRAKFYSAKQDNNCQWYGIHNGFDVIRKDYVKIKNKILSAFSSVFVYKVAAIIHGTGGCGKSTLLRRLAIEASKETDFEVIWVNDRQLENFTTNALPKIQADINNKYLIFIEDWYRLTDENKEIGNSLLKTSQTISNLRLVIGDRDIEGKDYKLNLINKVNIFELKSDENKKIINDIVAAYDAWKTASELVLRNENSYESPLFIILFVIAGISEDRLEISDVDFSDVENTAQRIGKYDLKKIASQYPGFAKALYYWACVYTNNKIFITYDTFLNVADSFNGNSEISTYFKNWRTENAILDKLKLYINLSFNNNLAKKYQELDFVQFNHDKLAETVLSKVELEEWTAYDDILKKKLLNTIINYGDNYSSAILLTTFLNFESQIFTDESEKKYYLDKLFNLPYKNRDYQLLSTFTKINLSPHELYSYIKSLKDEGFYHSILWLEFFRLGSKNQRQAEAKEILVRYDIITNQEDIVSAAFKQSGNEEIKKATAKEILEHKDILQLPAQVVSAAFRQGGNEEAKKNVAKEILECKNLVMLRHHLVVAAFKQPGNEQEKKDAAKEILGDKDIAMLQPSIVVAAFGQPGNDEKKKTAAKEILLHKDIVTVQPAIVVAALGQPGNENEIRDAAKKILGHNDIVTLQHDIVVAAFRQPGNEKEKQDAAKKILGHPDIVTLEQDIVVASFGQSGNEKIKQIAAKKILAHQDILKLHHGIVVAAFRQPGNEEEKQAASNKIFDHYHQTNQRFNWHYCKLMSVPLNNIPNWKIHSKNIINNWANTDIRIFENALYGNRQYPDEIQDVCWKILDNWETEVLRPIKQVYGKSHYGDHIEIALGHPSLKKRAKKTAYEIVELSKTEPEIIPRYLLETAKKITEQDEFPIWQLNNSEETDNL